MRGGRLEGGGLLLDADQAAVAPPPACPPYTCPPLTPSSSCPPLRALTVGQVVEAAQLVCHGMHVACSREAVQGVRVM